MSARGIVNAGGGSAWGNIFTVNTPYLDNLGKQIYATEQNRQLQQQKESDLLDSQFSKEVANIRDADVNEYADKYNNWKQAKIGLMKMNGNTSNPNHQKAYIQAQMDANRKLADMSQFGNNSIANKAILQSSAKGLAADKTGDYKDNAADMIRQAQQTPSSKLNTLTYTDQTGQQKPYDPLNEDSYKYEGNMVKWQPILSKAEGTKVNEVAGNSTPITDKNGTVLGTNNTTIKAKNSPLDYYTNLVGSLTGSGAQKSLNATFKFSDDEAQQIVEQYQNQVANNPTAQKAWGEGVKLPLNALLVPSTRTAALQSMRYALSNLPQETAAKPVYNRAAIMDKREANSEQMQQERFHQQDLMKNATLGNQKLLYNWKTAQSQSDQNNVLNNAVDNFVNTGTTRLAGSDVNSINIDGKQYQGKVIQPPSAVLKDFVSYGADGTPKLPDAVYITNDKKTVIPLFLPRDPKTKDIIKGGGGNLPISSQSKPQPIDNLKSSLAKFMDTKKQAGADITNNDFNTPLDVPEKPNAMNSYNVKGKKYTHSDLNKMGYSDEQIKQAIKIGTIK
jgi:hypothetical protein